MPVFHTRSYEPELLDRDDIPFEDIRRNMQELDFINTWLGGHDITIQGLKNLLVLFFDVASGVNTELHICEIGCGGGDNLRAIDKWMKKRNMGVLYTGIDINPYCISVAKSNAKLKQAQWITSDYKAVQFANKPHIIFCSLFCHHFTDQELINMLRWMEANATVGYFINDLHRHRLAYYSIKILTSLFSRSYLVKNDAPLSVLRGFSRKEIERLMQQAGQVEYSIEWRWAFRWLVVKCKT